MVNKWFSKIFCSCLLIISLFFACRQKPITAESLINNCAKAMGGVDKIAALQTMRLVQNWPDHPSLIRYELKRPNLMRMGDFIVFDGKQASWLERKSADGKTQKAELIPQEEYKDFEIDFAWYFPAFFDYPAEYMGTETIDRLLTYKLRVNLPMGGIVTYYLNTKTFLIYKVAADFTIYEKEYHTDRIYSDYRTNDGITYPYAFTYEGRDGIFTATMEKLEFNVPISEDRFALPLTVANK